MVQLEANVVDDLKSGINHGILVSNLTYLVAQKMGLPEKNCYQLAVSGMLHDIGKLRMSDYLYGRNEESLAVEEMKYMRMHSKMGYEVLLHYSFPEETLQTVLYHHECYDGSGYPGHLKGEDIPLGARILKVTDTFAALISERPYRKAFTAEEAMQVMIDEIKDLDMEVFIAFQRVIHDEEVLRMATGKQLELEGIEEVFEKPYEENCWMEEPVMPTKA